MDEFTDDEGILLLNVAVKDVYKRQAQRIGIRMSDFISRDQFAEKVRENLILNNKMYQ